MPGDRRPRPRVHPGHDDVDRPRPPALAEVDIDRAVADLNRIYIVRGLETMIAIGRYVLDTLFDGDEEAFRSRRQGYTSFKKLYGHTALAMSYGMLGIAVNVMLQVEQLPRDIAYALGVDSPRLGRRPLSPPAAALRQLEKYSRELARELRPGGSWEQLSAAERSDLAGKAGRVLRRMERVVEAMEPE